MQRLRLPLAAIFITVLLDLLSFGMIIPDIQLRGEKLVKEAAWLQNLPVSQGLIIGLTIAVFSITQFLVSPYLGRLSDNVGRRRVLLITTALSTASLVIYAFADQLWVLLLARILQGAAAGNLAVAYAYISDVTETTDRAKAMGSLGAAFGIGFILGPPFGAFLLKVGGGAPMLMGLVAAVLALVNFCFVWFFLPESKPEEEAGTEPMKLVALAKQAFQTPGLGFLLALFFAVNFGFANLESTYFRMAHDEFRLDEFQTSLVLVVVGIASALMQGALIPVLTKHFRETVLVRIAFIIQTPTMMLVPFMRPWFPMLTTAAMLGGSSGLAQPNLSSLISKSSPRNIVGGIFGVTNALGALARIIGPMVGNVLYDIKPWAPYIFAGCVLIIPLIGAWFVRQPLE